MPRVYFINADREEAPLLLPKSEDGEEAPGLWGTIGTATAALCLASGLTVILRMLVTVHTERAELVARIIDTPFPRVAHPVPPAPAWEALGPPYPTGAWWTNLALPGHTPAVATPYAVAVSSGHGLQVSYGAARRTATAQRVVDPFAPDVELTAKEQPASPHTITAHDAVSVTFCAAVGAGSWCCPLVKGGPFVTVLLANATPHLRFGASLAAVDAEPAREGAVIPPSPHHLLHLAKGPRWLLYSDPPVAWAVVEGALMARHVASGVLRLAAVPSDAALAALTAHSAAYPVGGEAALSYNEDFSKGFINLRWRRRGSGPLLMLALPHHMDSLLRPVVALPAPDSYTVTKGPTVGIRGDTWTLEEPLTAIRWAAKLPITRPSQLAAIREALDSDILSTPAAPDVYTFGKQAARLARLCLIADEVGRTDVLEVGLGHLEGALWPWLSEANKELRYDTTYGGVCTRKGLADKEADYGNGQYNDHHFHYGYLIYAAAVLARYRPTAAAPLAPAVVSLIGDIANMDPAWRLFPLARHKDLYEGHSWASGITPQGNGKSQESVSEAANAYYAVSLYGLATQNSAYLRHGRVLLAMELRAARKYWQVPRSSTVYPLPFTSANRMVGVVGASEVMATTWFSPNVEHVHCINMLPFTPITEELLPPSFIAEEYPTLAAALLRGTDPVAEQWRGFIVQAHAIIAPDAAWAEALSLTAYDNGNSRSNALHWVATRPPPRLRPPSPSRNATPLAPASPATTPSVSSPSSSSHCSDHPACAALRLGDYCCPTVAGAMLDCCAAV